MGGGGNGKQRGAVGTWNQGDLVCASHHQQAKRMFEVQRCQGPSQPDASTLAWTWLRVGRVRLTLAGHENGLPGGRRRWRLPKVIAARGDDHFSQMVNFAASVGESDGSLVGWVVLDPFQNDQTAQAG